MSHQLKPTSAQWVMIVCAAVILVALVIFGIWEIRGILSGMPEQTFSEWVWDLDLILLIPLTATSLILAIVFGWFTIHIWEGYVMRKRLTHRIREIEENQDEGSNPPTSL